MSANAMPWTHQDDVLDLHDLTVTKEGWWRIILILSKDRRVTGAAAVHQHPSPSLLPFKALPIIVQRASESAYAVEGRFLKP